MPKPDIEADAKAEGRKLYRPKAAKKAAKPKAAKKAAKDTPKE